MIGVPNEDNEDDDDVAAGAVNVIYGTANGLNASNDQFWWQASSTLHDSAESGDKFGSSLGR